MSASLALLLAMSAWFCWFDFLSSTADRDNNPNATITINAPNISTATREKPARQVDALVGEPSFWRAHLEKIFTAFKLVEDHCAG
jgi:hypothetical protein